MSSKVLPLNPYDGTMEIVDQIKKDASQEVPKFFAPASTSKPSASKKGSKAMKKGRSLFKLPE